jgi:hypothetical protein
MVLGVRAERASISGVDSLICLSFSRPPTLQFELMENGEQRRQMRRYAGSVRFVYNKALALAEGNVRTHRQVAYEISTR